MCNPIRNGSLGIRRLRDHNSALLAKWHWRFGRERDSLWFRVVVAQFGEQSVWESKSPHGRHGCGIWMSIFKVKDLFWSLTKFQLGMG